MAKASDPAAPRGRSAAAMKRKALAGTLRDDERATIRVGRQTTRILAGLEDLSEWSDDELKRGRRKDKNGKFQGRDPVVIPKQMHDELAKRLINEAQVVMRDNLVAAVTMLTEIATDPNYEAKDRVKAIQMMMDRVMGKSPEKIELSPGEAPWEIALLGGIVPGDDEEEGQEDGAED